MPIFLNDLDVYKNFLVNKQFSDVHKFFNLNGNYGVKINTFNTPNNANLDNLFVNNFSNLEKEELVLKYSKNKTKQNFLISYLDDDKSYKYNLERVFYLYQTKSSYLDSSSLNNSWYNTININFIRKERLYTKLKYSRSPAYDIVSGGAAALFAGLLGFLVSEKFGIELVDSGDFYYLFMYIVFLCFSIRPLLVVAEFKKSFFSLFSINRVFRFYTLIVLSFIKFIKSFF